MTRRKRGEGRRREKGEGTNTHAMVMLCIAPEPQWGGGGREAVTHPRPGSTLDYGIQLTEGRYWGVRMYKPCQSRCWLCSLVGRS